MKKVLISAPAGEMKTIGLMAVNDDNLATTPFSSRGVTRTTNCPAPMAKVFAHSSVSEVGDDDFLPAPVAVDASARRYLQPCSGRKYHSHNIGIGLVI